MLLRAEQPLTNVEAEEIAALTGARVFRLSHLFRFETLQWDEVYYRFREGMGDIPAETRVVFVLDMPRDSPLQLVIRLFLRVWLKAMRRQGRQLVPALLIRGASGAMVLRLARPVPTTGPLAVGGSDRLRRFLLAKLEFMDSALELQPFYGEASGAEQMPLASPENHEAVAGEIDRLPDHQCLCRQGDFEVWLAQAGQIPHTLREIGRLREITFRAVGEGTGKALDIDEYDLYYEQLIIWDVKERRIAGGYRLGRGDHIFGTYGAEGFYIHSLFRIKEGFYPLFPQALELGRSYIVEAYQKKRLPLFLLWKGILHFLLAHPQYRYLYGPVSISRHFTDMSRSLIVHFARRHFFDKKLAKFLKPRKKFRYPVDKRALQALTEGMEGDWEQLSSLIEDIEPRHFKLPVLLRQYVRQNARFIAFNLDPHFSDALDGFILLDLRDVPPETLEALRKESAPERE